MTWKDFDVKKVPCEQIFKKYSLADNSVDFVGHALALHVNDDYLKEPAAETLAKIQLYMESMGKYGDSPFLYPLYGLGGLPESFSRLCAIHGGTYMLNTAVDEIMFENGAVCGVRVGNDVAKAPLVLRTTHSQILFRKSLQYGFVSFPDEAEMNRCYKEMNNKEL